MDDKPKNYTPINLPVNIAVAPVKRAFFNALVKKINSKPSVGRPTDFTDANVQKLKTVLQMGATIDEACRNAGIARSTFYYWKERFPIFSDMVDEWMDNPILAARAVVYKAINKDGDPATAKWFLERKKKDEFSLRTELTGADGQELLTKTLDKLEKTDYDALGQKARRQMVATNASVQNKG
jgi:hypothetical protein